MLRMLKRKSSDETKQKCCPACGAITPKLTADDVAAIIKVSVKTVRNGGAGTDELPREYYGKEIRFDRDAVQAWLDRKAREANDRIRFLRSLKRSGRLSGESRSGVE